MNTLGGGAVLVGFMVATAIAGMAVVMAFTHHALRFFRQLPHGGTSYADQLSAGIWISAIGAVANGIGGIIYFMTDQLVLPIFYLGWSTICAGLFFKFYAWHGAAIGRFAWFRGVFGVVLIAIVITAGLVFATLL